MEPKKLGDLFSHRKEKGRLGLPMMSVTINSGLIQRDSLGRKTDTNLSPEEHLFIKKGDIAYNMMRMWQGASGLAEHDGIVSPAYVVLAPKNGIDPTFASYWLKSPRMIYLLGAYSYGLTKDRLRLYFKDLAKIPASPPPIEEQKQIVSILTTWDTAIEQTAKLIVAKQKLKKGLAQQLLTGKRRLPGFRKPWAPVSLGKMGRCVSGGTPDTNRPEFWDGAYAWCTPTDVTKCSKYISHTERQITEAGLKSSSATLLPKNALIVCTRATIGECALSAVPIATNQGFKSLIFHKSFHPEFVFYSLVEHKRLLQQVANGSTFLEVSKGDFCSIELPVPELVEQDQIAAVFGAADREVTLLEKKLASLKRQKEGLFQKLLTGQVRLEGEK